VGKGCGDRGRSKATMFQREGKRISHSLVEKKLVGKDPPNLRGGGKKRGKSSFSKPKTTLPRLGGKKREGKKKERGALSRRRKIIG